MEPEDAYSMSRLMLDYNNQLAGVNGGSDPTTNGGIHIPQPTPTAPAFISTPVVLPSMFASELVARGRGGDNNVPSNHPNK